MIRHLGLNQELQCPECGRDFHGDTDLKPGDACPSDDCPSHEQSATKLWADMTIDEQMDDWVRKGNTCD